MRRVSHPPAFAHAIDGGRIELDREDATKHFLGNLLVGLCTFGIGFFAARKNVLRCSHCEYVFAESTWGFIIDAAFEDAVAQGAIVARDVRTLSA
jgi:hypothetical protein